MARGSITRGSGKHGVSWLVTYDVAPDPVTGKRRQKRFTARTRKEVEERQAKTPHELRSGVLSSGDHIKVVSERLGLASVRITVDTYSHILPDTQRASADRLDEALGA